MSAPRDVVWKEDRAPFQWVGMHYQHKGGIRCDSRIEAEKFMRDLCSGRGCSWVGAYNPAPALRNPAPTEARATRGEGS